MQEVISKDGTKIAFEKWGAGEAVILVNGAMGYRAQHGGQPLAAELAKDFSVYIYDRRGRGDSSDTPPYAVEREIEDIAALIDHAGGSAYLYGISSGAVLALRTAARLGRAKVAKLAIHAPPLSFGDEAKQQFAQYVKQMDELLKAGKHGDAVALFLADMLPPDMIEGMRQSPGWLLMEAVAPTLAYGNAVLGDSLLPVEAARAATMPVLIIDGSESPAYLQEVAEALVKAIPQAQIKTLEGETYTLPPQILAPALAEFFKHSG